MPHSWAPRYPLQIIEKKLGSVSYKFIDSVRQTFFFSDCTSTTVLNV